MSKKLAFAVSLIACILLAGCDTIDSMRSNAEDVVSKLTNQESSSANSETSSTGEVSPDLAEEEVIASVDGSSFGVYADVTDVAMTSEPNKISLKFTVGTSFSIEESLTFTKVEVEKDATSEAADDKPEYKQVITCEEIIRVGDIADFQKVFDYMNRAAFETAKFKQKDNAYTAALEQPYILAAAPLTSYTDCKAYCEDVHTKMRDAIDNSKRIRDGATGIVYHNIGGDEFNLTKYRYQVRSGDTVQIEIQNIPDGFTPKDVTFRSDKVGYAKVSGDGTITGGNNGSAVITVSLKGAAVYRTVYVQVF